MAALSLYLLGATRVILEGQQLGDFRSNKVQALLIYLAAEQGSAHRREHLMTLLWPGMPERSARHNLRNVLYHLRQSIPDLASKPASEIVETGEVPLLIPTRQTIQINPAADVESDVANFETFIDSTQSHEHLDLLTCHHCRTQLERAVTIYEGDFLTDFYLADSETFEEWAHARREHYRRKMLDALEALTVIYTRQKAYAEARGHAERQLEIDNLRESAYRQLMSILALSGQRSEAMSVYETCRRLLREELGMAPSTRTTEIYEKIQAGDLSFDKAPDQDVRGYDLKETIGEGAYGVIHKAIQPVVGREVAVKVIRRKYANDPEFIRRFEAEAQTVARLEHPYIVPLYDYWRDPAGAYLVMRYLKGGNLLTSLEGGPWDAETTLKMLDQITSALAAAHRQGVVHRDIKPANILLDDSGNAYLSDFGIAKNLTGEVQMTAEGAVIGTPDYISPEQILDDPVSPQSDIYSLGAVLYETLTGEKPFPDSSVANLIYKHLNEPVPLVSASRPDLPHQIDEVIQKATAKRPVNRYADALAMAEDFRLALRGSELTAGIVLRSPKPLVSEIYNPYKGLRAFQEADADDFFGRAALIDQLVARLAASRFLALVGPSGSGKSSVVKAGLIPALRQGAIKHSDKWFVAEMVPGSHPLEELELALLPIAVDPPPSLVEPMRKDNRGLLRTIRRILPSEENAELVLIIDQFEELFTLVEDEGRRSHFLDSLLQAITASRSPLRVVITLRADFYDRPLALQPLGQWIRDNTEVILPMAAEELIWAIQEPARRVGVGLEEGLATAILADLADEPGALPLLQYGLTELFDERQNGLMTREAYGEMGGILGALGQRAEELYVGFDDAGREAARQLFLRLVTLGEGVEDTRRRVLRSELASLGGSGQWSVVSDRQPATGDQLPRPNPGSPIPAVIDAFGQARLLTLDHDPVTRGPTVEVAHEALLREWGRLRSWLDESRADIRLQRLLAASAAEWRSAGQDPGFLLQGSRLDQFESWSQETGLALTQGELDFLEASLSERQEREAEEEARRRRELETARQLAETEKARAEAEQQRAEEQAIAARGFRRRAYVLAGVLVVAVLLAAAAFFFARQSNKNADQAEQNALVAQGNADLAAAREADALAEAEQRAAAEADALSQRDRADAEAETAREAQAEAEAARAAAEQERENAQEQALIAQSRELAAAALANLDADPELSILLALQGLATWHTPEAESILHQAIVASPLRNTFLNMTRSTFLVLSADGRIVYVSGRGGGSARDTTTGELLYTHPVSETDWIDVADFSPDGSLLALPIEAYDELNHAYPGEVTIVDARTGRELVNFVAHDDYTQIARFSRDGSVLATESHDNTVKIWDVEATLASGTGQLAATFCCIDAFGFGLDFDPGNQYLAIPTGGGELVVWDVSTEETRLRLGPDISGGGAEYSPDGQYLVSAGKVGNIDVWDARTGELLSTTIGHSGNGIARIHFSADGDKIVTAIRSGEITVWRFSPDGLEEIRTLPNQAGNVAGVAFSPDGRYLYTSYGSGTTGMTHIWDISPAGSAELVARKTHDIRSTDFKLIAAGSQLLTVGHDGMLRQWGTGSWEEMEEIRSMQAHEGRIDSVDVIPDGQKIATASPDDVTPKVWDADTWQQLFTLEGHELQEVGANKGVNSVRFSPDGQRLATGATDGTVRIWDAADGTLLHTLVHAAGGEDGWVTRVQFSPDGKLLASISGEPATLKVWDPSDGRLLLTLENDPPTLTGYWGLQVSPDGKRIVVGSFEQEVEMWQLPDDPWAAGNEEAKQLYRKLSGAGQISEVAFSPDGERIVVAGSTGLVEIRDAATGDLLVSLQHPSGVTRAKFTPDGKRLMTSGHDGIFRVWALDLDELVTLAHSRVTRDLTDEECQQYLHLQACPDAGQTG